MFLDALVVGAGSVGQHHLARCIDRYGAAMVVEPDFVAQERIRDRHGDNARVFTGLDEATQEINDSGNCLAIIANWGPDHFATVEQLVEMGIRRILLEKPATNSLKKSKMLRRISDEGVTIIVGVQRRFTTISSVMRVTSAEYLGSEPTSIVASGGAVDVSTTGLHLLDLAVDIFQEKPIRVTGDGASANINPRSETLLFWDGVVVWTFESGRRFSLHLDNRSSISPELRVYARDGYMSGLDETINVHIRDVSRRAEKITRHSHPTKSINVDVPDAGAAYERIFESLEQADDSGYPLEEALVVNDALLCGLYAIENRTTVGLPASDVFEGFATDWAAS